ncbi:MAG: VCBS repeat-containing protein [Acidobacteria bacterium]|nr:VCBS repeat-containing protein [Acidobacteriota bacterium]
MVTTEYSRFNRVGLVFVGWLAVLVPAGHAGDWQFTEVGAAAGVTFDHGYVGGATLERLMIAGGVAAGDYDGDGWVDLFAVGGTLGPNRLFRNRGDGTFEEVAVAAGVAGSQAPASGPTFADLDGDGWLDLVIGGIRQTPVQVYRNQGDGTFVDASAETGLVSGRDTFSAAFGDYDRDGDLDAFLTHWGVPGPVGHLWRNDGGSFTDVGRNLGVSGAYEVRDFTFSPNFADLDGDGWPDLVVTGDFGTSRIFRNLRGQGFQETTSPVITDENGMGAAIGDYDGDGDLDWFVSSIWDPTGVPAGNWGITGNRLYRNRGDGTFEDATDAAGVRHGYWGWGSCFGDFDNDGDLDLLHVNGFPIQGADPFFEDPAVFFVNQGDGTFEERGGELGIADTGQGRGVVCFDYDRDGDLDVYIANNSGPSRLYRNDLATGARSLALKLVGEGRNTEAIGARIWLTAGGRTQMRELRAGSNFVSQDPAVAHFGVGNAQRIDELRIRWPDGEESVLRVVPLPEDGRLILEQAFLGLPVVIPALSAWGLLVLAALILAAGWALAGLKTRAKGERLKPARVRRGDL